MTTSPPPGLLPAGRHAEWTPTRPRFVLCDVDGTVVGEGHAVSPGLEAAAARSREAGLLVGLATGRPWMSVEGLAGTLGLPGPHVVHNGAEVRDGGGNVLAAEPLPLDLLDGIVSHAVEGQWYAEVYAHRGYWVTRRTEAAAFHWEVLGAEPDGLLGDLDWSATAVPRVMYVAEVGPELDRLMDELASIGATAGAALSPAVPHLAFVNVTGAGTDKGSGLRLAAHAVGLDPSEVLVVGDAANDLPMFAAAGTAVAMGQAEKPIRDAAHLLAPTVGDGGLARVLDVAARGLLGDRAG